MAKAKNVKGGHTRMKKIIAMALCLLLALGCVAFAEGAPEETGTLTIYYSHSTEWADPIIEQFLSLIHI